MNSQTMSTGEMGVAGRT